MVCLLSHLTWVSYISIAWNYSRIMFVEWVSLHSYIFHMSVCCHDKPSTLGVLIWLWEMTFGWRMLVWSCLMAQQPCPLGTKGPDKSAPWCNFHLFLWTWNLEITSMCTNLWFTVLIYFCLEVLGQEVTTNKLIPVFWRLGPKAGCSLHEWWKHCSVFHLADVDIQWPELWWRAGFHYMPVQKEVHFLLFVFSSAGHTCCHTDQ